LREKKDKIKFFFVFLREKNCYNFFSLTKVERLKLLEKKFNLSEDSIFIKLKFNIVWSFLKNLMKKKNIKILSEIIQRDFKAKIFTRVPQSSYYHQVNFLLKILSIFEEKQMTYKIMDLKASRRTKRDSLKGDLRRSFSKIEGNLTL